VLARVHTPSPVRDREREKKREGESEKYGERKRWRIVQNCYFYFQME
jgi:hypothetical protein